jgi:hypothetical protein
MKRLLGTTFWWRKISGVWRLGHCAFLYRFRMPFLRLHGATTGCCSCRGSDGETFLVYDITTGGKMEPSITRQMMSQTGYCVRGSGYFFFSL